ncbi:hypothetical protein BDD12DRAFT_305601 [Trichophaea hybrida]|nr:hypothetical protein BDD12DRAFT_305601 [Trichophaea hybrida]
MSTGSSPSIGSNTPSLPSPRTSRFLGSVSQFSTSTSPISSAAASIPVLVSRSVNSSNSLVGQLLSVSGNAGTATGATPYGMIISAGTASVPSDKASGDDEQDDGGGCGGGGTKLDMRRHSYHSEMAEKIPPELKIPPVAGYTDLSAVYAIVNSPTYSLGDVSN